MDTMKRERVTPHEPIVMWIARDDKGVGGRVSLWESEPTKIDGRWFSPSRCSWMPADATLLLVHNALPAGEAVEIAITVRSRQVARE